MALIDKASLLMVPSTYEDGTLYNVLPSGNKAPDETGSHNGYDQTRADFTFSRGNNLSATRIGSDGLIEKGRENLLLQSEAFSASWSAFSATATTGQSGYDGTTNALLLTSTGNYARIQQASSGTGIMTASCYMKAGTTSWGMIRVAGSGYNITQYFDLENGVIGSLAGVSASINLVSDGWYRCEVVANVLATPTFYIYTALADGNLSVTDETITIQSPQLEKGLVATTFIPTTSTTATAGVLENTPRIDYSSGAGALLLEPLRSNLVTYSEYFEHSLWDSGATTANVSKSPNLSPEGLANCYYVENVSGGQLGFYTTITSGASYTGSFWVRKVSGSGVVRMINVNNSGTDFNVGTEWTRVSVTATSTSTTGRCYVQAKNTGDIIEVYGAQLEAGSYASSYIPTYGSAASRSADSCYVNGNNGITNVNEFTMYSEFETLGDLDTMVMSVHNDSNKVVWIIISGAGKIQASVFYSSTFRATIATTYDAEENTLYKVAYRVENGNCALYVNGAQIGTSSDIISDSGTLHYTELGNFWTNSNTKPNKKIQKAIIFPSALTNEELAALTA